MIRNGHPSRYRTDVLVARGVDMTRWFILWQAMMAAATTAVAGSQLSGLIGPHAAGAATLVVGSLQTGTVVYASLTGLPMWSKPR